MRVLGLMSGTSLDGIDAAILETDGETLLGFGPAAAFDYLPDERQAIESAIADALAAPHAASRAALPSFAAAEAAVTAAHIRAIDAMLSGPDAGRIDLIGFPGQTVLHRPDLSCTVQVGDACALSARYRIDVVHDFRSADVAAGGQGAPFVPLYHAALAATAGLDHPVAFLNLGGVGNVTWIGGDGRLLAFDTGPGNGLIDQWMVQHGLGSFDADGRLARQGQISSPVMDRLMQHAYFARAAPKSLDRYDFTLDAVQGLGAADGAATLTAFTAVSVAASIPLLPAPPKAWVLCGGGRRNATLVARLTEALGAPCINADTLGWRGDTIEAEAFAFLAVRCLRGLPLSVPGTTGVPQPQTGGRIARPPH
ncbi:anhydro-N-acetylmuramic acid kinase [Niveispirillum lacus]|uniref:Anhydro-N-acetylmuramic acid kinase n=1 Tax=Niveispirillum lacus TaxID=1981099 RepID=A0A255ZA73_9PROT|nr:anhydro-N-acetylmuramic acid kinase [Niveispirillum lacus]OYQ37794.1 anhydro-N-acetylmuramic acid kinase [Niveispirillum lacus]